MQIKQEVAASRFLTFVGATATGVGVILVLTLSSWFWILCGAAWPIMFLGLWGQNAIKMGIDQKEAEKAAKAAKTDA